MSSVIVKNDRYTVDPLYQWDLNQVLEISGLSLPSIPEIHFTNETMDRAIVRQATMNDAGIITADIPNSLLQKPNTIKAYVCIYEGETFRSLYMISIPVKARKKPSDYTIEDTDGEIYSFNALENRVINALAALEDLYNNTEEYLKGEYAEAVENIGNEYAEKDSVLTKKVNGFSDRIGYLENYVTPQMFGAKGDGVTDDTEAILSAIESLNEGDLLYFPRGTYVVTSDISVNLKNIHIKGAGRNNSTIDFNNTESSFIVNENGVLLSDMTFKNGNEVRVNKYHCTINSCHSYLMKVGFYIHNGYIDQLINCYATFNTVGVILDTESYETILSNCVIDNNDKIGVLIVGSSGARITDCTIEGNRDKNTGVGVGLLINSIHADVKVDGCWFETNGTTDDSVDILFYSNTVNPVFNNLVGTLSDYPLGATMCGNVKILNSKFVYTKYGVSISGWNTDVLIKGCSFTGGLDKYNIPVDIYNDITSLKLSCENNKVINTDNATITTQMLNGVKSSYIYTDLSIENVSLMKRLRKGGVLLDGEPLFVYKAELSDFSNIKYLRQTQAGTSDGSYEAGCLNGYITNSFENLTSNIALVTSDGSADIFDKIGQQKFIILSAYTSLMKFKTTTSWLTAGGDFNGLCFIRNHNIEQKTAYANDAKQVIFAVILFTDEEIAKMKQCLYVQLSDLEISRFR